MKKPKQPLKLDLGCGMHPKEGFTGVDCRKFPQVAVVADLRKRWPWPNGSVSEVHCAHFVEHLTAPERIHFVNELYRVLQVGAKATIITPHWASCRAYGDLTHQWPPVSEFWWYYLSKTWRSGTKEKNYEDANAPHNDGYTCDFESVWGYNIHPSLNARNDEYKQYAMTNYKEAAMDMLATLTKK